MAFSRRQKSRPTTRCEKQKHKHVPPQIHLTKAPFYDISREKGRSVTYRRRYFCPEPQRNFHSRSHLSSYTRIPLSTDSRSGSSYIPHFHRARAWQAPQKIEQEICAPKVLRTRDKSFCCTSDTGICCSQKTRHCNQRNRILSVSGADLRRDSKNLEKGRRCLKALKTSVC